MSDIDDILNRLRACWCADAFKSRGMVDNYCDHDGVRAEAADEIERLRAQIDRVVRDIQIVSEAPSSTMAKWLLWYYYPLKERGRETSITFYSEDEAVRGE